SAIKGASEILQMPLPEEKVTRFAGNIERESDRMQSLIDKLLELARLEKRPELEQVEAISLKQMVNEVVESADARLSAKSVTAKIQIDDHLAVLGDAFLLKQAVFNLMDNALDFVDSEGCIEWKAEVA
ncbi:histidine kinase dimerization/phospho-acceptor domain-containing protein, partial [Vibrio parahaemolyticus]|uniref:histidine kinase dimerization/phospho-acceptor domain-containing protein n=2 Tax=Vibrionaceae TaxID=641 RepID=UPI00185A5C02